MAVRKLPNKLRDEFLFEYGIRATEILYQHREHESYVKSTSKLFTGDKNGDMIIYYPTLDGFLERYSDKGVMRETYRKRIAEPYLDKTGKQVKYNMIGRVCMYFPPAMIRAYQNKTQIETLIVTEGEKKAFVACKNGFDCVGISGIWNFCSKPEKNDDEDEDSDRQQAELIPSLKEFIKVCGVKNVVKLDDSDALELSKDPRKAATARPAGFCKAVKRFAELMFQEGVKVFYSYINPHLSDTGAKYGLDDLIKHYEDYNQRVLLDFYESVAEKKYTSYFCTTQIQFVKETFIKEIFHLNDPTEFYKHHKAFFKDKAEFRFDHRVFTINHAEGKLEEKKNTGRESIWIKDGQYWGYDMRNTAKCFSNFTMNVLFLLKSHTNPKRIIEFKNILGQSFVKELTMDDLVGVSAFRKKLIADGSFIYKGDMYELLNLSEMLFKDEKMATELTSLGWQKNKGFFAFSNGITSEGKFFPVDEFGIVTHHEDRFYLPAFSNLYTDAEEAFENERNFRHIESDVSFAEWSALFYKVYKHNGAIGICFYIAALFRDIIFGEFKEFPLLNLFGQKGSGKSTMAKSLMYLFGAPQSAISLENASSTKKGIYRKFSQYRNSFVWLDEYKNTIHPNEIGLLKNLFDGIGYERAQTSQDNRTHTNPVLSSAIVSGQDMPTIDPALFTRVILLMFKNNQFTSDDQTNYAELKRVEKTGLTGITINILSHRELISAEYKKEFKIYFDKLNVDFKLVDIPDRLLKNAAMLLAPVAVLQQRNLITLPFSSNVLYAMFVDMLKQHKDLLNDNQEISVFWETVETLFDEGIIAAEKGHLKFLSEDAIAIRFNPVYAAYSEKYIKMFRRNGLDKLTLINYLKNSPAFVEVNKSIRFEIAGVTSGFVFKQKQLGINLNREPVAPKEKEKQPDAPIVGLGAAPGDNDDLPF